MKNLEKELPYLNDVVFGVILKFVVKKEQNRLLETKMNFSKAKHVDLRVQWPRVLRSNCDRLIHHTNVKLLSNSTLSFDYWKLIRHRPSIRGDNRHVPLRLFEEDWKVMKHFGSTMIPPVYAPPGRTPLPDLGFTSFETYASPVELLYSFSTFHPRSCKCSVCIKQPTEQVFCDRPLIQTVDF